MSYQQCYVCTNSTDPSIICDKCIADINCDSIYSLRDRYIMNTQLCYPYTRRKGINELKCFICKDGRDSTYICTDCIKIAELSTNLKSKRCKCGYISHTYDAKDWCPKCHPDYPVIKHHKDYINYWECRICGIRNVGLICRTCDIVDPAARRSRPY